MHIITFCGRYFDLRLASLLRPAALWFHDFSPKSSTTLVTHTQSFGVRTRISPDWQINAERSGHAEWMTSRRCIHMFAYIYKYVSAWVKILPRTNFWCFCFFFLFFVCVAWIYIFRFTSAELWAIFMLAELGKYILLSDFLIQLTTYKGTLEIFDWKILLPHVGFRIVW